jgi:hypothetical protein
MRFDAKDRIVKSKSVKKIPQDEPISNFPKTKIT